MYCRGSSKAKGVGGGPQRDTAPSPRPARPPRMAFPEPRPASRSAPLWRVPALRRARAVVCLAVLSRALALAAAVPGPTPLHVGVELRRQKQPNGADTDPRVFRLRGLGAGKCYEVKVSYPGITGARFSLGLAQEIPGAASLQRRPLGGASGRRLLDTEKIIFCVDGHGLIQHRAAQIPAARAIVTVSVERTAVLPYGLSWKDMADDTALYNIVCEELLLGLPRRSWPLLGMCLGLALLSALAGYNFRAVVLMFCPTVQRGTLEPSSKGE